MQRPSDPPEVQEFLRTQKQKSREDRGEGNGTAGDGLSENTSTPLLSDEQPDTLNHTRKGKTPDEANGAERSDRRGRGRADGESAHHK